MLTVFRDAESCFLCDFLDQTINSTYYSDMLIDKVKLAVMQKHPGFLRKGVILLLDKACPHTAQLTRETINKLACETVPHPPYSPDLALSDFHLFGPKTFHDNGEVKENVPNWLQH